MCGFLEFKSNMVQNNRFFKITIKNQITSELIIENQTLTGFVQFQRDIQVDIIMYLLLCIYVLLFV